MNIKISATIIALALGLVSIQPAHAEVVDLNHAELNQRLSEKLNTNSELVVIDVRSAQEFASGHVPGAVNISHHSILSDVTLLDRYQDQDMVFYCRSGKRAKSVTDALESGDYTSGRPLYHLDGDILGWISAGQALQK
ncbi:MAG: rhodanese-like domain-containing protein [Arenicella sp.]|nr:rhodanese-like domain-containing protein [Arenicella sp.]